MTGESSLPFGRTNVDRAELEALIDTGRAETEAAKGGVESPVEKVAAYVDCLPALLEWLEYHGRDYPWRRTHDPWEVYLAEILLQRTRGDAVKKIYDDVIQQFPDPEALNEASNEDIRETVHSLGFVNHRERTLNDVGQIFTDHYDGGVPDSVADLKEPWRVGDYSARATQLFAREQPMALVDANFAKVIGRVFGYEMPDQPHKSSDVYGLLEALTPADPNIARAFNLAILDLGALVCTPASPDCDSCPLQEACEYYQSDQSD